MEILERITISSTSIHAQVFSGVQPLGFSGRISKRSIAGIAGIASSHLSNIMESYLLAPLTAITIEIPLTSTAKCRLAPTLPSPVGLGVRFP